MSFSKSCGVWSGDADVFFRGRTIRALKQRGPTCVATCLAMLSGRDPEYYRGELNTQDPVSWSDALRPDQMKLAYCPTDMRRMVHYLDELVELDDLFLLCYYTQDDPEWICSEPDEDGWICGSHVVVLHRDLVFNPSTGRSTFIYETPRLERAFCKRLFRVVPVDHHRGL